jgi:hypothetical protein
MTHTTLQEMREAVKSGHAKILTTWDAERLKGKRIRTVYLGYRGQDGVDEFVVGDIIDRDWIPGFEPKVKELLTQEGKPTHIRNHYMLTGDDVFTCSDIDRLVYYVEVEQA